MRLTTPDAPAEGWDERVSIAYETSPGDRAVLAAVALRQGTAWAVVITDGSEATANKRSAKASLTCCSMSLRMA